MLSVGGTLVRDDIKVLKDGQQVVVGTPGRVYDMINRNVLSLAQVRTFVLDEADEMLSRGFKDQIYDVFQHLPPKVQVCLFSATMPQEILEISQRFMRNPIRILVKREEETEMKKGGIIIPDTAKEKPQEGKVIAVGNGRVNEDGKRISLDVKAHDRILFGKYSGSEVKVDDQEYLIMKEDDVLAIIE